MGLLSRCFQEPLRCAGAACIPGIDGRVDEDLTWVNRLKSGDSRAFDFLVKKYQKKLYAVLYNLTANKEDASDLTQDVFVKAFRGIDSFNGKSSFFTWIYRIAVNTGITFVKKNKKTSFYSLENFDDAVSNSAVVDSLSNNYCADKAALLSELNEKLNDALQTLSVKHRAVIVLHEIEGMNQAEVATILKCSEGTVKSRLHYAKEQLKTILKKYLKDDEK